MISKKDIKGSTQIFNERCSGEIKIPEREYIELKLLMKLRQELKKRIKKEFPCISCLSETHYVLCIVDRTYKIIDEVFGVEEEK